MVYEPAQGRIYQLFAQLLDYPQPGLAEAAQECEALLSQRSPKAAGLLRRFRAFVDKNPLGKVEEVYTGVFELNARCHPYVGYHLFGESYKRSVFLLGLKERYRAWGFVSGSELPDHLAVMLRFLALCEDPDQSREIVWEALLPALDKMTKENEATSPESAEETPEAFVTTKAYQQVLQALRQVLSAFTQAPLSQATTPVLSPSAQTHVSTSVSSGLVEPDSAATKEVET